MHKKISYSIVPIIILLVLGVASIAAAEISEAVMGNGLKILVDEDHSAQLVAIDVWVKAGTINETAENNGISHFVEHMLFKGTKKRTAGQADLEIESLGATLDGSTSWDWAHFRTTVASRYFDTAIEVLADMITSPTFKSEDIERERRVIIDEIARRDNDPLELIDGLLHKTAFKEHPYGLQVEGTKESVSKLSRDDILDYYNTYYVPNNTTVVIVGNIDKVAAVSAVGKYFTGYAQKELPERKPVAVEAPAEVQRAHLDRPLEKTHMMVGFSAPGISDANDVIAMDVLLSHIGVGYRSWINTELKDKQKLITAGIGDFLTHKDPGVIALYASVDPDNVDKVEKAILDKVRELRTTPLPENEVARAKRSLEGSYAFDCETYSGWANSLGFYESLVSYKFAVDYISNVRKVTAADLMRVAQKYMDPEKAVVVTVGPKGATK